MYENMKLGIFHWFGYVLPFTQRIKMIKDTGFDSIMLWWEPDLFSGEGLEQFNQVRKMDIDIENIHVPYEDSNLLWSSDEMDREKIIDMSLRWIHDCYKHEVPMIVMHVTEGHNDKIINDYGLYSFEKILLEAEKYKIKIALENTRQDEFLEKILDNFSSPWLGVCYDSSHANLFSKNITYLLDKYSDRLMAIHLSDNDGQEDRHWLPQKGEIDWNNMMMKLKEIKYKGNLSFEVYPEKGVIYSPQIFLQSAYNKASELKGYLKY